MILVIWTGYASVCPSRVSQRGASEDAIVSLARALRKSGKWSAIAIFCDNCDCSSKVGGDLGDGVRCFPGSIFESFFDRAPVTIDALLVVRYGYFFLEHVSRARRTTLWLHDDLLSPWWCQRALPNGGAALLSNVTAASVVNAIVVKNSSARSFVTRVCPSIPSSVIHSTMEAQRPSGCDESVVSASEDRSKRDRSDRILVYWVAGVDPAYFRALTVVSMKSLLCALGPTDLASRVDLCLLCDASFASAVRQDIPLDFNVLIVLTPPNLDAQSTCARKLEVHMIPGIETYGAVLYLDSDVIIDPEEGKRLAEAISPTSTPLLDRERLYIRTETVSSGWQHNPWFGRDDYTPKEVASIESQGLKPMNAGQFLFVPSKTMLYHFKDVLDAYTIGPRTIGWEQSFLNAHFLRRGKGSLNDERLGAVAHLCTEAFVSTLPGKAMYHLIGLSTGWKEKAKRMKLFLGEVTEEDVDAHDPPNTEWWTSVLLGHSSRIS